MMNWADLTAVSLKDSAVTLWDDTWGKKLLKNKQKMDQIKQRKIKQKLQK